MLYTVLWATMAIGSDIRVVSNSKTIKGAEFLHISAQNHIAEDIWNVFKKKSDRFTMCVSCDTCFAV